MQSFLKENVSTVVEGSLFKFGICHYHLFLLIQSPLFSPDHRFAKGVLSEGLCFIVSRSDVKYIDEK